MSEKNIRNEIHPTSLVSSGAKLGNNVLIGPFSIIHDNCIVGDNTRIGSYCEIGLPAVNPKLDNLEIGSNSLIRSHSVLYSGSALGSGLETGHHVVIRENTNSGVNLRVGSFSDLQGDLEIGNFVRLHSNVHLGKFTKIEDFVWIFPFVVTTNDPMPPSNQLRGSCISKYAVVATGAILMPGIRVGENALIGANSTVTKDVADYSLSLGVPARHIKDVRDLKLVQNDTEIAGYPWRKFFSRGYPENIIREWVEEGY